MPELKWLRREVDHWHSRLEVSNAMDRRIAQVMYRWRTRQYKERGNNWSRMKNKQYMQRLSTEREKDIAEHKRKWNTWCEKQDTTHS